MLSCYAVTGRLRATTRLGLAGAVRAKLSLVVEELGGKVTIEQFGRLEVGNASFVVTYDRKQIEAVILKLIDMGQYHIADAIRSCKKGSVRPGMTGRSCNKKGFRPGGR